MSLFINQENKSLKQFREKEVLFYNWTGKDFECSWDGMIHVLKAGKKYHLPLYKAEHFAKHLIDRYYNENNRMTNSPDRGDLEGRCFVSDSGEVEEEKNVVNLEPVEEEEIEDVKEKEKFCDYCDSKGVRHKRDCSREESPKTEEEEFEGLK